MRDSQQSGEKPVNEKVKPIPAGLDVYQIIKWLHAEGRHAEAYRVDNGAF